MIEMKNFEGVKNRGIRDRKQRPKLNIRKYEIIPDLCPYCGAALLDEYKGHYACSNCHYVSWDKTLKEKIKWETL
jgi:ribosomal protein S27AE